VNIAPAFSSENKIKSRLCSNKDRIDEEMRSGIYKVKCETCSFVYIGQTSRPKCVRCNDHKTALEKEDPNSAVAKHFMNNKNHILNIKNSELIKQTTNDRYLDAWESWFMFKYKDNLMNEKPPPLTSPLFKYFT
jgi:hypothetical protein